MGWAWTRAGTLAEVATSIGRWRTYGLDIDARRRCTHLSVGEKLPVEIVRAHCSRTRSC